MEPVRKRLRRTLVAPSDSDDDTEHEGEIGTMEQRFTALDLKTKEMEATISELKGLQSVVLTQQATISGLKHEVENQTTTIAGFQRLWAVAEEQKNEIARLHTLQNTQSAAIDELQSVKPSLKAYHNILKEISQRDYGSELERLKDTIEYQGDAISKLEEECEDLEGLEGMVSGHEDDIDSLRDLWTGKVQIMEELQDGYLAGNETAEQRLASLETKAKDTEKVLKQLQLCVAKLKKKWRRVGKAFIRSR